MNNLFLGIDIGGTKTGVCLGDATGNVVRSLRMPSLVEQGPGDWFVRTSELTNQLLAEASIGWEQIESVGISAPGPLSVEKGLLLDPPNMIGWVGVPVVKWFSELSARPVVMNNDANAAALAEFLFGKHAGCPDLVYLTLSTGLGGGIISGGRLLQGACDMAGEVGYHVLDVNGPESPCGHRGSLEAFCGGRNLAERVKHKLQGEGILTSVLSHAGSIEGIDARAIAEAVRDGDRFAREIWCEWLERLAQGVGNLVMILNPRLVLLGTIAVHASDLVIEPLVSRVHKYVHPGAMTACSILPATLGAETGNKAALAVAISRYSKSG